MRQRMKLLIFTGFFPALLMGQFAGLAITDDGGQVYFSSSYRQTGTDQFLTPKIFRYTDGHFELYRQVQVQLSAHPSSTNLYQLGGVSVSGDGTAVAFNASGNCGGGSSSIGYVSTAGHVDIAGADGVSSSGPIQVNGSGRYVVRFGVPGFPVIPATLVDLITRAERILPSRPAGDVADDGTVLLQITQTGGNSLSLWKADVSFPIGLSSSAIVARLSRNGRMVVFQTASGDLRSFNVVSGREVFLANLGDPGRVPFSMSNDGSQIVYIALASNNNKQLYIHNTDGTGRRQLTNESAGISSAVLSGFATFAYAGTNAGHLLRLKLPGGESEDLSGPTPVISDYPAGLAPRGLFTLTGMNLSEATVLLNGTSASPITSALNQVTVQVPYQAAVDQNMALIVRGSGAAFEYANELSTGLAYPQFYSTAFAGSQFAVASHSDFRGLVTPNDPAIRGETLHFYMTGLGAVVPAIPDSTAAPSDQLYRSVIPINSNSICTASRWSVPFYLQGLPLD